MIGLMNGLANGHANRPFTHPVVARLDKNNDNELSLEDLEGTRLGDKFAAKFGTPDSEAGEGRTTIQYTSFKAEIQTGSEGFSLSVSIVKAMIVIDSADLYAIEGGETPVITDEQPDPVEDVPNLTVEPPVDEAGLVTGTSDGEAAITIMDNILESMDESEEETIEELIV